MREPWDLGAVSAKAPLSTNATGERIASVGVHKRGYGMVPGILAAGAALGAACISPDGIYDGLKSPKTIAVGTDMSPIFGTQGVLTPSARLVMASYTVPDGRAAWIHLADGITFCTATLDAGQYMTIRVDVIPDAGGAAWPINQDIGEGVALGAKVQVTAQEVWLGPNWTIQVSAFLSGGAGSARASSGIQGVEYTPSSKGF
jgi:hypothetical protein